MNLMSHPSHTHAQILGVFLYTDVISTNIAFLAQTTLPFFHLQECNYRFSIVNKHKGFRASQRERMVNDAYASNQPHVLSIYLQSTQMGNRFFRFSVGTFIIFITHMIS